MTDRPDRVFRFLAGAALTNGGLALFYATRSGGVSAPGFGQSFAAFVVLTLALSAWVGLLSWRDRRNAKQTMGHVRVRWTPRSEIVIRPGTVLRERFFGR